MGERENERLTRKEKQDHRASSLFRSVFFDSAPHTKCIWQSNITKSNNSSIPKEEKNEPQPISLLKDAASDLN